jgi:hypothetical protein
VSLLVGALPSWERALEKEWSNPSFDHLQNKRKRKEVLLSLATVQPLSAYGLRPTAHNETNRRKFLVVKRTPP